MIRVLVFNALFLAAVGYALIRGGKPERAVAIIFCLGLIASDIVLFVAGSYYRRPEIGGLVVDGLMFAGLVWVALASDRYWPLLMAALQGASLLAHLARLIAYDVLQNVYLNAVQLWSYPELILLMIGTARVDLRSARRGAGWWPLGRRDVA